MFRTVLLLAGILSAVSTDAAFVEVNGGGATRMYAGAAGENLKYATGVSLGVTQNQFLLLSGPQYDLFTGICFDYHSAASDDSEMIFYQGAAAGEFSLEKYFASSGFRFFHLYFPLHAGIGYTKNNSGLSNIDASPGIHPYAGAGAGLSVRFGDSWGLRTAYGFDAHFMKGGVVQAHSLLLGGFYRFPVNSSKPAPVKSRRAQK